MIVWIGGLRLVVAQGKCEAIPNHKTPNPNPIKTCSLLGNILHFAYCGLVGIPHLSAEMKIFAPLPTSTKKSTRAPWHDPGDVDHTWGKFGRAKAQWVEGLPPSRARLRFWETNTSLFSEGFLDPGAQAEPPIF